MPLIDKRHDVFISYSHKDNPKPDYPITKLVDLLKKTYHDHYDGEKIDVFFDIDGLKSGELWENKLLESLRQSAVMIVILSDDYYNSEYCYKEWQHFQDVEIHYSLPGKGIIPKKYREHAANQEPGKLAVNVWVQDLQDRQYTDISDWETNRNPEVFKERLLAVCEQIHDRKRQLESRKLIPTNVRPHNVNFTGRAHDIRKIRNALIQSVVGVITAVKGIGGIGKSTIAFEYAHAHIDDYQGGTFVFNAEGQDDFRIALASIAAIKGIGFTDEEKKNLDLQCQRVWRDISHGQPALLILDNVDKPDILKHITDYAPDQHQLHILVTSRQGFTFSKTTIQEFRIEPLEQSLALDLLLKLFSAKDKGEKNAANEICRRLGGHPLALTMVGTYLANIEGMSYSIQLELLEKEGIKALDKMHEDISLEDYAHPVPSYIFGQVFSLLTPTETQVLEYAALLPPDSIPLPWIYELVKDEFPEIASDTEKPLPLNPWKKLLQRLDRLQLLPSVEEPKIASMHRLIQEAVWQTHDRSRQYTERLIDHAHTRAVLLEESLERGNIPPESLWKTKLQPLSGILVYVDFTQWAHKIADFESAVGDLLIITGSLTGAEKHYEESLEIRRRLAAQDPDNTGWQRGLTVSLDRIGYVLQAGGDLAGAKVRYEESLEIRRRLAAQDPDNAGWQRDLTVSLNKN